MSRWFPEVVIALGDPDLKEVQSVVPHVTEHPGGKCTVDIGLPPAALADRGEVIQSLTRLADDFEGLASRAAHQQAVQKLGRLADDFEALARRVSASASPSSAAGALRPPEKDALPPRDGEALVGHRAERVAFAPATEGSEAEAFSPAVGAEGEKVCVTPPVAASGAASGSPGKTTPHSARGDRQVRQGDAEGMPGTALGRSRSVVKLSKPAPITTFKVQMCEEPVSPKTVAKPFSQWGAVDRRAHSSDLGWNDPRRRRSCHDSPLAGFLLAREGSTRRLRSPGNDQCQADADALRRKFSTSPGRSCGSDQGHADAVKKEIHRKLSKLLQTGRCPSF
jgi:hypothetical protein